MKNYIHSQGHQYQDETHRYGFLSIRVLECLTGKPWDEIALAFVSALRPSYIRVIRFNSGETMDAMLDRVTVYLGEDELITKLRQEVRVWLPENVAHGSALRNALETQ